LSTLKHSASLTEARLDHEHVTLHIRNHPEIYSILNIVSPPETYWPGLGLTLDEPTDFELLKKIIENFDSFNPFFSCRDVVALLREKPDWVAINNKVVRKGDT